MCWRGACGDRGTEWRTGASRARDRSGLLRERHGLDPRAHASGRSSNSLAGVTTWMASRRRAHPWCDRRHFTTATRSSRCRSNRRTTSMVSTRPWCTVIDRVLVDAARRAGAEIAFETELAQPRPKRQRSRLRHSPQEWSCARASGVGRARDWGRWRTVHGRSSRRRGMLSHRSSCDRRDLYVLVQITGIDGYHWSYGEGVSASADPDQ